MPFNAHARGRCRPTCKHAVAVAIASRTRHGFSDTSTDSVRLSIVSPLLIYRRVFLSRHTPPVVVAADVRTDDVRISSTICDTHNDAKRRRKTRTRSDSRRSAMRTGNKDANRSTRRRRRSQPFIIKYLHNREPLCSYAFSTRSRSRSTINLESPTLIIT